MKVNFNSEKFNSNVLALLKANRLSSKNNSQTNSVKDNSIQTPQINLFSKNISFQGTIHNKKLNNEVSELLKEKQVLQTNASIINDYSNEILNDTYHLKTSVEDSFENGRENDFEDYELSDKKVRFKINDENDEKDEITMLELIEDGKSIQSVFKKSDDNKNYVLTRIDKYTYDDKDTYLFKNGEIEKVIIHNNQTYPNLSKAQYIWKFDDSLNLKLFAYDCDYTDSIIKYSRIYNFIPDTNVLESVYNNATYDQICDIDKPGDFKNGWRFNDNGTFDYVEQYYINNYLQVADRIITTNADTISKLKNKPDAIAVIKNFRKDIKENKTTYSSVRFLKKEDISKK